MKKELTESEMINEIEDTIFRYNSIAFGILLFCIIGLTIIVFIMGSHE